MIDSLCTIDFCDPISGCKHAPLVCSQGTNPCITVECVKGGCIPHMKDCSDNDNTTKDWCDQTTGNCTHIKTCPCEDNLKCTDDYFDEFSWTCVHKDHVCSPYYDQQGHINHCFVPRCDPLDGCVYDETHCAPARCEGHKSCITTYCEPTTGMCAQKEMSCDDGMWCFFCDDGVFVKSKKKQ
jgi:hypothetical protein